MRVRLTGLWQEIKILCAHHERKAHDFLKKMAPKKTMGENERTSSKKELNDRAKSGHNPYFLGPFITII